MRYLSRAVQAAFVAAVLALASGCSDETSVPLAIPSEDGTAGKDAQNGEVLPANIVEAVTQAVPGGTIVAAVREKEGGKTVYEVQVEKDGNKLEVELDPEGNVLEIEDADSD